MVCDNLHITLTDDRPGPTHSSPPTAASSTPPWLPLPASVDAQASETLGALTEAIRNAEATAALARDHLIRGLR